MRKYIIFLLAIVVLCGCGEEKSNYVSPFNNTGEDETSVEYHYGSISMFAHGGDNPVVRIYCTLDYEESWKGADAFLFFTNELADERFSNYDKEITVFCSSVLLQSSTIYTKESYLFSSGDKQEIEPLGWSKDNADYDSDVAKTFIQDMNSYFADFQERMKNEGL